MGDEGGFAPNLKSNVEALEVLLEGISQAGYKPGEQIGICIDPASSEFFQDGKYVFKKSDKARAPPIRWWRSGRLGAPISHYFARRWHVGRRLGWVEAVHHALGTKVQLVGDDVFVTNSERLQRGIHAGIANSILVKVNQIGTLTETLEAMRAGDER